MRFSKYAATIPALALTLTLVGPASAAPIYNDFYQHFNPDSSRVKDGQNPPDDIASWAYAANSADAFGGVIGFGGPARIATFSVIMSNWNGWDPTGGPGTATLGYQTDLTLELYNVDRSGTNPAPGSQILTSTETQDIAGRQIPTAQNASFVDGGGTDFVVDWDLGNVSVGSELMFMVVIDELLPGNSVTNTAVNSLNIAAFATGTAPDVTAGIDTDPGVYWRSDVNTGGQISRFEAGQVMARVSPVPLPAAGWLLLVAVGGLGLAGRRKRKAA